MFSSIVESKKGSKSSAKNPDKGTSYYKHWSHKDAQTVYDIMLMSDPELAATHYKRGEALVELGRPEEALAAYDTALTCDPKYAAAHVGRGIILQLLGRLDDALVAFDTALIYDPNDTFAHTRKGLALQALGQWQEALTCCNLALTIDPKIASAHYAKGQILISLSRPQEALAAYDVALILDPKIALIHEGRSKALHALGRHREALEAFETAYTLNPSIINLTGENSSRGFIDLLHELKEKLTIYEAALKLNPNDASAHHNTGLILMRWGRPQDAVEAFTKAITLCPHNAIFLYGQGQALMGLAQYQDALETFRTAVKLKPRYTEAYKEMGVALRALGNRSQEALEVYDELLILDPKDTDAHCRRGFLLRALGQHQEALVALDAALNFDPKNVEALFGKGIVLRDMKQLKEALKVLNTVLALDLKNYKPYSAKGLVLREMGQMQEALEAFNKAIALNPKYVEAYNGKGVVFLDLDSPQDALQNFNIALELDSNSIDTYANRGGALRKVGRYQEALRDFDIVLKSNPKDIQALNGRGLVLNALGQREEALAAYDTALTFDPQCAAAHVNRGIVLSELDRHQDALISFQTSLKFNSKHVGTIYTRMGLALVVLGRHREALDAFLTARKLNVGDSDSVQNSKSKVLSASKKDKKHLAMGNSAATLKTTRAQPEDVKRDLEQDKKDSLFNARLNAALTLTGGNKKRIEVKKIPTGILSKDIKKYFPQHIDLNSDFLQKVKMRFDAFSLEELERWDGSEMLRLIVHETPAWRRCLSSDREDKVTDAEFGSYLKNIAAEIQQRLASIDNNDKWQTLWKEKALMKGESAFFENRVAIEEEMNLFLSNIKGAVAENRNAMKVLYGKWEEFRNKLGSFIARCKRQERSQRKEMFVPTKTQKNIMTASLPVNMEEEKAEKQSVDESAGAQVKRQKALKTKESSANKPPQPTHQKFGFWKETPAVYAPNTEWKRFFSQFLLVYKVLGEEVLREKNLSEERAEYLFGYMQECVLYLKAYVENADGASAYINKPELDRFCNMLSQGYSSLISKEGFNKDILQKIAEGIVFGLPETIRMFHWPHEREKKALVSMYRDVEAMYEAIETQVLAQKRSRPEVLGFQHGGLNLDWMYVPGIKIPKQDEKRERRKKVAEVEGEAKEEKREKSKIGLLAEEDRLNTEPLLPDELNLLKAKLMTWGTTPITIQNSRLNERAGKYGFSCAELKGEGNGFFEGVVKMLRDKTLNSKADKLTVEAVMSRVLNAIGQDASVWQKSREYLSDHSSSTWWLERKVLEAATQVTEVRIAIVKADGSQAEGFGPIGAFLPLGYENGRYVGLQRGLAERDRWPQPQLNLIKELQAKPTTAAAACVGEKFTITTKLNI